MFHITVHYGASLGVLCSINSDHNVKNAHVLCVYGYLCVTTDSKGRVSTKSSSDSVLWLTFGMPGDYTEKVNIEAAARPLKSKSDLHFRSSFFP